MQRTIVTSVFLYVVILTSFQRPGQPNLLSLAIAVSAFVAFDKAELAEML